MSALVAGELNANGGFAPNFTAYSEAHFRSALAGIKIAPLTQPACHSTQSVFFALTILSRWQFQTGPSLARREPRPNLGKNILDSPVRAGQDRHHGHDDSFACRAICALVSGLPKEKRQRARLVPFQAWFDESGKSPNEGPVFSLSGYSARDEIWKDYADEWNDELEQPPRLRWLHATEAYNFTDEFGYDRKTLGPKVTVTA
jgi:hypothetical protein